MKLHPEDPRLTAYVLGELSPVEAAAIEKSAAADPELRAAMDGIRRVQQQLQFALGSEKPGLLPSQRESILRGARSGNPTAPTKPAVHPRWLMPMVCVAIVGIVTMVVVSRPPEEKTMPSSPKPAPAVVAGPGDPPTPSAPTVPAGGRPVTFSKLPLQNGHLLALPVVVGGSGLKVISASVLEKRSLPPAADVHAEEMINALDFKPVGTSSIAKGASLTIESVRCPWKPSATLLMVRFQGAANGPREVEAMFDADQSAVSKVRLLGSSPAADQSKVVAATTLPAGTSTVLMLEIEPRASATTLGEIRWKVDGKDVPALPVLRVPDAVPSADIRFAALIAVWSMWLTHEQTDIVDEDLVSGLGRQCAEGELSKERRDALVLIAKSLEIER